MQPEKKRISFCTVCMNRLAHLKQTLKANIKDNETYGNLEFVLLDYNSGDGLEDYAKDQLKNYIKDNRLVYYKTCTPKYFNRSHSRNLLFKLATGDIICNIDADNYTGKNFAAYVNNAFCDPDRVFLSTLGLTGKKDVLGRIGISKTDFLNIGGFDETMVNYGFEDYDIINRLQLSGVKKYLIEEESYLKYIPHTNAERICSEQLYNNLHSFMIKYLTPASSELWLLFKNNQFTRGTIVHNRLAGDFFPYSKKNGEHIKYTYSILEDYWIDGHWRDLNPDIELFAGGYNEILRYDAEGNYFRGADKRLYPIKESTLIEEGIFFYSQVFNRIIMEDNLSRKNICVNPDGFGKDTVYKNFDYNNPVTV